MIIDDYLKSHADLIATVLPDRSLARDWRIYTISLFCIVGATGLEAWAARALIDPGFFARLTIFVSFLLFSGVGLLSATVMAEVLVARTAIPSRHAVIESALGQIVKASAAIAHRLVGQSQNHRCSALCNNGTLP